MKITVIQTAKKDWLLHLPDVCGQIQRVVKKEKTDFILLPEGYCPSENLELKGESLDGKIVQCMKEAAKSGNCLILFGMVVEEKDGFHNSAILVDGKGTLWKYDKTHLYHSPTITPWCDEQRLFVRGEKVGVYESKNAKLGVMICHDGCYMEYVRTLGMSGADMIFWLMNCGPIHLGEAQVYAKLSMMPVALANGVGGSGIVDGNGKILCQELEAIATELTAEVDLPKWAELRKNGEGIHALYQVRRPDLYSALSQK